MAFCVIAIHTTPLKGIDNNIIYILYEAAVSIAVPFFFLSTGYLIGRKIQNKKEFDDVLVERQQKKVIRYLDDCIFAIDDFGILQGRRWICKIICSVY